MSPQKIEACRKAFLVYSYLPFFTLSLYEIISREFTAVFSNLIIYEIKKTVLISLPVSNKNDIFIILEKSEPHSLSISEIIDSK